MVEPANGVIRKVIAKNRIASPVIAGSECSERRSNLKDGLAMTAACFFTIILSGCSPALTNLASLGANRQATEAYVQQQKELFAKLSLDLKNARLKTGTPLNDILSAYGEPILRRAGEYQGKSVQVLLYRHPLNYFSSDMIYLYFDKGQLLTGWVVEPA